MSLNYARCVISIVMIVEYDISAIYKMSQYSLTVTEDFFLKISIQSSTRTEKNMLCDEELMSDD